MEKMSEMLDRLFTQAANSGALRPGDFQWAMKEYARLKQEETA